MSAHPPNTVYLPPQPKCAACGHYLVFHIGENRDKCPGRKAQQQ